MEFPLTQFQYSDYSDRRHSRNDADTVYIYGEGTNGMSRYLEYLIERARRHSMTDQEREAQIRSFAYGNTHLENGTITKADIDKAADSLQHERAIRPARS